ncbi:MAG: hypothetical protein KY439_12130 [Actinobacteria bacterium]|nr:hypothetical protein [Actinomycetota bacterium]
MPRLLTLLFALFVPPVARQVRRERWSAGLHAADPERPLFDLFAEALFDRLAAVLAAARRWAGDAAAVVQGWVAAAVDPACPTPVLAPCLASGIAREAPAPSRFGLVGSTGRSLVDGLEARFAPRWPNPGHARMAAGLFMTAVALVCAGIVGIVAVLAPSPGVHLQRVSGAASVPVLAAGSDAAAPAPAPAPDPHARASTHSAGLPRGLKVAWAGLELYGSQFHQPIPIRKSDRPGVAASTSRTAA